MAASSSEIKARFEALNKKPYADQAKFFLNAYWEDFTHQAEHVWKYAQKMIELDPRGKEGFELDEFGGHRFLESLKEALTVVDMRRRLEAMDLDFNHRVSLTEFLLYKYNKSINELMTNPQGGPEVQREIEEANKRLVALNEALADLQRQLEDNYRLELESKEAAEALRAQQIRLSEAVEALNAQEEENNRIKSNLRARSEDFSLGAVSRGQATAQLQILNASDPLPLRQAQITQQAALASCEKKRAAAERAAYLAAEGQEKAQKAIEDIRLRVQEAQQSIATLTKRGGVPHGAVWWMNREIIEVQKYLPQSKQNQRK